MNQIAKTIPFTPQKYKEMQDRFAELKELRKEVMKRLVTARAMGDLSENGAYQYAKFELGNIGRELRRYRKLLAEGYPAIKNEGPSGVIDFGSEVTLEKCDETKKQMTFMLVSEHESDPAQSKLSQASPIGQVALHKKVGDVIKVTTPKGVVEYKVVAVE